MRNVLRRKLKNRLDPADIKTNTLSFRDTLMGKSENDEEGVNNEGIHFSIKDADVKLVHDDRIPAIFFSERA